MPDMLASVPGILRPLIRVGMRKVGGGQGAAVTTHGAAATALSVLGSWGKAMRGAGRNKESGLRKSHLLGAGAGPAYLFLSECECVCVCVCVRL